MTSAVAKFTSLRALHVTGFIETMLLYYNV
jgi:hypothetical protein